MSRVVRNFDIIEQHLLLVYLGALPFTPVDTMLFQHFHDREADLSQIVGGYEQSFPHYRMHCWLGIVWF